MPASEIATILTTAFSSGGVGTAIVGGLVSGYGMAKMREAEMEKEEAARIAEEKRLSDSYEGAAESIEEGWRTPIEQKPQQGVQRARANSNRGLMVGEKEQRQMPGQQYRTPKKPRTPRWRVENGQIMMA